MEKNIDTVKAIIISEINNILILDKASNEYWDLPGGHVNEGESPYFSIIREIKEETGMRVKSVTPLFIEKINLGWEKNVMFFLIVDNYQNIRLSPEHTDYNWIFPIEMENYNLGVYEPILRRVFDIYGD